MMDNITLVASLRQWRWFVLSAFKLSVPTPVGQVPKWAFLWLTRNAYLCLWHVRTSSLLPRKCFLSHGCMALTICIECTIHITGRGCWAVFMPPLWKDKYNLSDHQIVIWISQTQPKLLQILRRQCCQKHVLQFCQSLVFVERRWLTCTCELISTLTRVVKIVGVIFSLPLTLLRVNCLKTWFCWVPSLARTLGWVACRRLIWVSCVLSFIELCDLDWVIWKK